MTSTRPTVALIGLGNIGFRHLQGLKSIANEIRLIGADINEANLARAGAEWDDNDALFTTGETPPGLRADLIIFATSSRDRLELLTSWGDRLAPRHVLLEKVAFTRMSDFDVATEWARNGDVQVAVNCPRRMWPLFHDLRGRLGAERGPIELAYQDPDLGLACNGVHIIDALQYLTGEPQVATGTARFSRIFDAKRAGYKEVYGALGLATPSGHRLILSVAETDPPGTRFTLRRGTLDLRADEASGRIETAGGVTLAMHGRPPYQSELTGLAVADLLRSGRSQLPSLEESSRAHRPLIEALEVEFDRAGIDRSKGLMIT